MSGTYAIAFPDGTAFPLSRDELERLVDYRPPVGYVALNVVLREYVTVRPGRPLTFTDVARLSGDPR